MWALPSQQLRLVKHQMDWERAWQKRPAVGVPILMSTINNWWTHTIYASPAVEYAAHPVYTEFAQVDVN